jgi:hypothetical protein
MTNSVQLTLVILTAFFGFAPAVAQIDEFRKVDGRTIECLHSGLMSDLKDCDVRSDWYAYVFVGSISAISRAPKDEESLQITPEEIFHGDPPTPLAVLTSQGKCLPSLAVGDHWLFFLRKENGKPIVLDYYGNDSLPIASAKKQIETLRRLKTIGDFGILRGNVVRGPSFGDREPVPGANVVASRSSDHAQFLTRTDADGNYEFQPLPVGRYELTADSVGRSYVGDAALDVSRGACRDVTLWKEPEPPHTRLSGHVKRSDGSPASEIPVLIMREDQSWFTTEKSDASGYFHEDSLAPGKYVVGINLPDALAWKFYGACAGACKDQIPNASLYYPGIHNRSDAFVITIGRDEKRDDIDFSVPTQ